MDATKKITYIDIVQKYGVIVIFVLLFASNSIMTSNFLNMTTIWNIIIQATPTIFIAMGMTLVISAASIDIAVGSGMALGGVLFSYVTKAGNSPWLGLFVALCASIFVGMLCGILISKFRIQPMITTMATMYIMRGLAKVISGGSPISYNNPAVSSLSYLRVAGVIPPHAILSIILFLIILILVRTTRYGAALEASGNNVRAAAIAGIDVVAMVTIAHIICAVLASIAGISLSIMVSSADGATLGLRYETNAIAATVVGGTPMAGGRANVIGTLFGALLLILIDIMVNMNGIYYAVSLVIKAMIIILAVFVQKAGKKA
jgi:ribose/xylose/arabinose/galactoside ABC-type transport system permease subunit